MNEHFTHLSVVILVSTCFKVGGGGHTNFIPVLEEDVGPPGCRWTNNGDIYVYIYIYISKPFWSQSPRGQRCGSAAVRLLGLWVRIPPGLYMSVSCIMCCQVEVSASGWSLVQRSPTLCGMSECDREVFTVSCHGKKGINLNAVRWGSVDLVCLGKSTSREGFVWIFQVP